MDTRIIDGSLVLSEAIPNVTQPDFTVELTIIGKPEARKNLEMLFLYVKEQTNLWIPHFYEARNDLPRGGIRQLLQLHASSLEDEALKQKYLKTCEMDDPEFNEQFPLRSITITENRVHYVFGFRYDPSQILFQKTVSIPFTSPQVWAEVVRYSKTLKEEAALLERYRRTPCEIDDEDPAPAKPRRPSRRYASDATYGATPTPVATKANPAPVKSQPQALVNQQESAASQQTEAAPESKVKSFAELNDSLDSRPRGRSFSSMMSSMVKSFGGIKF